MRCLNPQCPAEIHDSLRVCATCGRDNGCPNVRKAQEPAEVAALRNRLEEAELRADARGAGQNLARFRDEVADKSVAVLAMPASNALPLLNEDGQAFSNFYRLVEAGVRIPKPNWYDRFRGIADQLLFPHYAENIFFAALSLDRQGSPYYGTVSLSLAPFAISDRATVFESNSLLFCRDRNLGLQSDVPPGYRAAWEDRGMIAASKLEPKLVPDTQPGEFSGILLEQKPTDDADFVEVHVYDRITRHSLSGVVIRRTGDPDTELFHALVRNACSQKGLACEEVA